MSDEERATRERARAVKQAWRVKGDGSRTNSITGETQQPPERAPVQGYKRGIPWHMHLDAYDAYCKKYGGQDALIDWNGRGCRGGFGTCELDDFIPGWREKLADTEAPKGKLAVALQELVDYLAYTEHSASPAVTAARKALAEVSA